MNIYTDLKKINKKNYKERFLYEKIFEELVILDKKTKYNFDLTEKQVSKLKKILSTAVLPYQSGETEINYSLMGNPDRVFFKQVEEGNLLAAQQMISIIINSSNDMMQPLLKNLFYTNRGRRPIPEWLSNSRAKREHIPKASIPYFNTAIQVLMNQGFSKVKAVKMINNRSYSDIEKQVGIKRPIDYAISNINRKFLTSEIDIYRFKQFVYEGIHGQDISQIFYFLKNDSDLEPIIMDALFAIHDGWVKDNATNFDSSDKKFQYLPSQLIGLDELKKGLLFVKPIFKHLKPDIEINDIDLHRLYNYRMENFFLNNKIKSTNDLITLLQDENFYPLLNHKLNEKTATSMIPEIEKRIGNIPSIIKDIDNDPLRHIGL